MEKVSFAGWRIKEGREDEWRHDVPSWYPHHLSSLESWFEARERERDKKRVKKYRGEIDSSIDFDFEEREQLPPSSYLSLSLCSLVTSISNGGSSDNATPPPPSSWPLAASCSRFRFYPIPEVLREGVSSPRMLKLRPSGKRVVVASHADFGSNIYLRVLRGGGRKGFCGCLIRQRGWGKSF